MRRPLVPVALAAVALVALAARAQGHDNSIDPGMTKAQVIEHLGSPASVKTADTVTYLFTAKKADTSAAKKADTTAAKPPRE